MSSIRIAVIGGGPGGLMTAYLLQKRATFPNEVTIFEATDRLGGKVNTQAFSAAAVLTADLVDAGLAVERRPARAAAVDAALLREVINGLQRL